MTVVLSPFFLTDRALASALVAPAELFANWTDAVVMVFTATIIAHRADAVVAMVTAKFVLIGHANS